MILTAEDRYAMAKALFGHVGGALDARMATEVRRLRDRVRDLEHEVAVLQATNAALADRPGSNEDLLTLRVDDYSDAREPAYS